MSSSENSSFDIWSSRKWIGCTAIGTLVGCIAYKKLFGKEQQKADVNRIVNNKWEIPVIALDEKGGSIISKQYFDLKDKGDIGKLSVEIPVKTLKFRTTPSDYNYDWHNAPKEQFIINLDAPVHVTTSDGNSILLKTGQVFMVKDISGKGHYSRSVNNLPRKSVFIAF